MNAYALLVNEILEQKSIPVQEELVLHGMIKTLSLFWMVTNIYMQRHKHLPPTVKSGEYNPQHRSENGLTHSKIRKPLIY
jgi:hypothetical protein